MIAALALAAAFATAPMQSETATHGNVRATVTYVALHGYDMYNVHVSIERRGVSAFTARVAPLSTRRPWNQPVGVWRKDGVKSAHTIAVVDLDRSGEPAVLLDFWTGGPHCCLWTRIYRRTSTGVYTSTTHVWGNWPYHLASLRARRTEFVGADNRFAYAFTDFAGSSAPVQIWDDRNGRLVDTTRTYPAAIARDADQQWKWYTAAERKAGEVRGYLAAWVADESLLGRSNTAFRWLEAHRSKFVDRTDEEHSGSAANFIRALRAFLVRYGYLT